MVGNRASGRSRPLNPGFDYRRTTLRQIDTPQRIFSGAIRCRSPRKAQVRNRDGTEALGASIWQKGVSTVATPPASDVPPLFDPGAGPFDSNRALSIAGSAERLSSKHYRFTTIWRSHELPAIDWRRPGDRQRCEMHARRLATAGRVHDRHTCSPQLPRTSSPAFGCAGETYLRLRVRRLFPRVAPSRSKSH